MLICIASTLVKTEDQNHKKQFQQMTNKLQYFVSDKINERNAIKIKLISIFCIELLLVRMENQNNTYQFQLMMNELGDVVFVENNKMNVIEPEPYGHRKSSVS